MSCGLAGIAIVVCQELLTGDALEFQKGPKIHFTRTNGNMKHPEQMKQHGLKGSGAPAYCGLLEHFWSLKVESRMKI